MRVQYQAVSVDALTYELVNKQFRNPVLQHARERLSEDLGSDLDDAISHLYSKEWEAISRSLDLAKAKGIDREPVDNLDRLSVNHFYVLFEKYFTILVPESSIPSGDTASKSHEEEVSLVARANQRHSQPRRSPAERRSFRLRRTDSGGRLFTGAQLPRIRCRPRRRSAHPDRTSEARRWREHV